MYDLIILGAGPAGITASIYAVRKKMNFIVITQNVGGQIILTSDIENFTGYVFVSGPVLVDNFRTQLKQYKVPIKETKTATSVIRDNDVIKVITEDGSYETKTVIIASGKIPRKLNVKGEDKYANRGVAYCATCDAPMFSDKDVAVIGGGNSALDAVLQLEKIANKIYLIDAAEKLIADPVMIEKAKSNTNLKIFNLSKVKEIKGDAFVSSITAEQNSKEFEIQVQGIFVEIGWNPSSGFIKGIEKNETGEIKVDCRSRTSIPGIFAAGDVTDVSAKQLIVACGEGAKAAISAFDYISTNK